MKDPRYTVVAGACLTQFTVIGFLFSYGVFIAEFQEHLGWSRTLLSVAAALGSLAMGVMAMLGGRLSDRFGASRVLAVTGVLYGCGIVLLSGVTQPWQLLALFATLIAVGLATHDVVTLSTIARLFDKRRGIMSAVVKVGTALGQMAVPPVTAALILGLGWRQALVVLGVSAAVLLVAAALLMRAPVKERAAQNADLPGVSFAKARQSRVFWTLCLMQFLFFATLMSVPFHLPVHGMDLGLAQGMAATLLSVVGGASIVGRLTIGALSDRIGGRNTYVVCLGALILALVGLIYVSTPSILFLAVAFYGFGHGGLFVVVSPTVARYFGMRAHGAIFGAVLFSGTIGGSFGPILLGWVFDTFGSYTPGFTALAAAAALALGLACTLPRPKSA
ncbi:transporter [Candidatus Rhodobacter oscarellae]|uniref:Transporter n=1 Tax=Candidatus Rhodobacter oscarellae TaxID=1675527 RepID=A0A0J9E634_9RHOB|nr:MFS transporter [Candidatus Rhodobacter lobularis]KMW58157.1 transporter [Candidatus Rhodobacter lobularis]